MRPDAVSDDGANSYQYNANGNMSSGKGRVIAYDSENRVASVTKEGTTTSFAYDDSGSGCGRRSALP